ncbi:MAG: PAS domain S-box protein [Candidatus Aureabacteria bacterium]|nr:PAS domain S-box protein [Candidatus Auribacterota bacterium]
MNKKEAELKEQILSLEDRIENYRMLSDYHEKVISENDIERIYSRLLGLVDHFLKPVFVAIFSVKDNFDFDLTKVTEDSWKESIIKEFDQQVEQEIIPWILNTNKSSIVTPIVKEFKDQDIRSIIIAPVSAREKIVGLLMAFKKNWDSDVPQNNMEFINNALKITALSIENAKINTQVKEKNKALEVYKDYNENIYKSLTDTFIVTNENLKIKDINKAGLHFLGYSMEELVGKQLKMIFPEDREIEIVKILNILLKEKMVKNYDLECLTKYGDRIPVNFSCSEIVGDNDKNLGLIVVIKDMADIRGLIEGLQRARDDLEIQKSKLEEVVAIRTHDLGERFREIQYLSQYMSSILQSMMNGVIAVDTELKVTTFNHAAEKITGIDDFEIIKTKISDFLNLESFSRMLVRTINDKKILLGKEIVIKNKEGKDVPVNVTTSLISTPLGEIRGAVAVFSDQSIIKDMNRKLIQNERMTALGEMSIAIAHELRNPLNVIRGLSEIVTESSTDGEKVKSYMDKVISQIDRLELLVSEMSEYVNQREPIYDKQLVMPFVEKSVMIFQKNVIKKSRKNIEISIEGQKIFPKCEFDRKQVEQVLFNILKNAFEAIKNSGKITVVLESDDEFLNLIVKDDGIGMPRTVADKVFEAFFTTKRPQKTGLGLAVCKSILEKHNGSINLDSIEGKGTTIKIKIPISQEGSNGKNKDSAN